MPPPVFARNDKAEKKHPLMRFGIRRKPNEIQKIDELMRKIDAHSDADFFRILITYWMNTHPSAKGK